MWCHSLPILPYLLLWDQCPTSPPFTATSLCPFEPFCPRMCPFCPSCPSPGATPAQQQHCSVFTKLILFKAVLLHSLVMSVGWDYLNYFFLQARTAKKGRGWINSVNGMRERGCYTTFELSSCEPLQINEKFFLQTKCLWNTLTSKAGKHIKTIYSLNLDGNSYFVPVDQGF